MLVTLGTGVGSGAVLGGKLYTGFNYAGLEAGHMVIEHGGRPCTCGRRGCFEAYCSATALIKRTREVMQEDPNSLLWKLAGSPEAVNGRPAKAPEDFSPEELDQLVEQFRLGAQLCREAGFDAVQIHTAHGYLLSNFLNPAENLRTDQYGGSLENRFHIVARVLQAAREACGPEMALLVKADCNGCGDLHRLLQLYQEAGADGVELSGVDFASRAGEKSPFYLQEALRAMEGIQVPLSLVGGIFDLETAEAVLEQGFSFVSFSRALICQPDFIARMKRGEQTKSACLACNGCYQIYRRRPVRCVQHKDPIPQLEKVFGCSM